MDQINILENIFQYVYNYLILRNVCRLWYDVCVYLIKTDKNPSIDIMWFKNHQTLQNLLTSNPILSVSPKGHLLKKYHSSFHGILFQVFQNYDSFASRVIISLFLTDYVGIRIGIFLNDLTHTTFKNFHDILKCSIKTNYEDKIVCVVIKHRKVGESRFFFQPKSMRFINDRMTRYELSQFRNAEKTDYVDITSTPLKQSYDFIIDSQRTLLLTQTSVANFYLPKLISTFLHDDTSPLAILKTMRAFSIIEQKSYLMTFDDLSILLKTQENEIRIAQINDNKFKIVKCTRTNRFILVKIRTPTKEQSRHSAKLYKVVGDDDFIVHSI
jgi:hypothetical protein